MSCQDFRPLVSAHIDGELDPATETRLAAHMEHCPECRALDADLRSLGRDLRAQASFQPPPKLASRVREALAKEAADRMPVAVHTPPLSAPRHSPAASARQWWMAAAAAFVLACGASAGTGWILAVRTDRTNRIEQEVLSAHMRSLLQDRPFQVASSDQHTVKPWFNGRADFSPLVKDLGKEGFTLVGGRLDYINNRRVAAIVYQRRLHVINLLMWPAASGAESALRSTTREGYHLMTWTRDGIVHWLASDLNEDELRTLADLL